VTSFNIAAACVTELSRCDYYAEVEIRRAEGEGEMTDDNPNEAYAVVPDKSGPPPPQAVDVAFLVTASELRDRKTKRRREHDEPSRSEAIRRLVELGLKAKK
jgi:hypothetical protein